MNSFSLNRFWRTMRWVLSVNRHKLVMWTAGSAVGVFIFEMMLLWMNSDSRDTMFGMSQFLTFLIYLASIIGFCSITSGIDKKTDRASMLMLPASNAEKFLSLLIYVSVVWPLCIFLAYAAGDLLRMGVRALMGLSAAGSTIPTVIRYLRPVNGEGMWQEAVFAIALFVFTHSWFVYVGTLLRRYAFIVSNLVLAIVFTSVAFAAVRLLEFYDVHHFSMFSKSWENGVYIHYVNPLVYPLSVMLFALAVLDYWRSYNIFKQMQLISHKWTNYNTPDNWKRYDFFIR